MTTITNPRDLKPDTWYRLITVKDEAEAEKIGGVLYVNALGAMVVYKPLDTAKEA